METNKRAILLCRVSSSRQAEGYSLDFQERAGRKYAEDNGFYVTRLFRIVESASKDGREEWERFVKHMQTSNERHILIPKVDRALRTFHDLSVIADMAKYRDKTFHFFHDGLTYHKDAPASDLLKLGIQGSMATWYSADLSEKTKRGLQEKRQQGEMPGRAPTGYINNKETHKIVKDPTMAPWVLRIMALSSKGLYSLKRIAEILEEEGCPKKWHISNIEHIIRNPFYYGQFRYKGTLYNGTHEPLITKALHDAAINGLERFNKPKYKKHEFLYNGLMTCGTCNRAVFAESRKKGRYIFYHCSGRLPCTKIIYTHESEITEQFTEVVKAAQISQKVANVILKHLAKDSAQEMTKKTLQASALKAERTKLENRIRAAYDDLYDPDKPEALKASLNAKLNDWQASQASLDGKLKRIEELTPDKYMQTARELLELSSRAFSLYGKLEAQKKREFLNMLCSNYTLTEKKLYPTYKKPFDMFVKGSDLKFGSGTRIRT
ncbi:MAG TPA: hypothetical protein DCY27_04575 [Desulfobacterales bacterium]|nr:hypothetical protein [Desulfobacterales bacterium]